MMHGFALLLGSVMGHIWAKSLVAEAQTIISYFRGSNRPYALLQAIAKDQKLSKSALITSNTTRMTSVEMAVASVLRLQACFAQLLANFAGKEGDLFNLKKAPQRAMLAILKSAMFWAKLSFLHTILQPVCKVIMAIQAKHATLSDVTRCAVAFKLRYMNLL
jgi:hypothetical protein